MAEHSGERVAAGEGCTGDSDFVGRIEGLSPGRDLDMDDGRMNGGRGYCRAGAAQSRSAMVES